MSSSFKMGLIGSKDPESGAESSENDVSKEKRLEHSISNLSSNDSKSCDSESLNAIDINSIIIGVPSGPIDESTLESEIDALSKIITDTKAETSKNLKDSTLTKQCESPSLFVEAGDKKIEVNDGQSIDNCAEEEDQIAESSTMFTKEEISGAQSNNSLSTAENNQKLINTAEQFPSAEKHESAKGETCLEAIKNSVADVKSLVANQRKSELSCSSTSASLSTAVKRKHEDNSNKVSNITNISNSLQMIGEAYISEDSQEPEECNEPSVQYNTKEMCMSIDKVTSTEVEQKEDPDNINPPSDSTEDIQVGSIINNVSSSQSDETSEKVIDDTDQSEIIIECKEGVAESEVKTDNVDVEKEAATVSDEVQDENLNSNVESGPEVPSSVEGLNKLDDYLGDKLTSAEVESPGNSIDFKTENSEVLDEKIEESCEEILETSEDQTPSEQSVNLKKSEDSNDVDQMNVDETESINIADQSVKSTKVLITDEVNSDFDEKRSFESDEIKNCSSIIQLEREETETKEAEAKEAETREEEAEPSEICASRANLELDNANDETKVPKLDETSSSILIPVYNLQDQDAKDSDLQSPKDIPKEVAEENREIDNIKMVDSVDFSLSNYSANSEQVSSTSEEVSSQKGDCVESEKSSDNNAQQNVEEKINDVDNVAFNCIRGKKADDLEVLDETVENLEEGLKENLEEGLKENLEEELKENLEEELKENLEEGLKENLVEGLKENLEEEEDSSVDVNVTSTEELQENIQETLTDILETMQCTERAIEANQTENIQDVVLDSSDDMAKFNDFLDTKESTEEKREEDRDSNLPTGEIEEKLAQEAEKEEYNAEMMETDSSENVDSLEGLISFDLLPADNGLVKEADESSELQEKLKENEIDDCENIGVIESSEVLNESKILEEDSKLELPQELLLESKEGTECLNDSSCNFEIGISNPEISELENAVKFLQESEEQAIESSLAMSPQTAEIIADDLPDHTTASLFASESLCENASEIVESMTEDSITISEAEIISEAVKLESERKAKLIEKNIEAETKSFERVVSPSENITGSLLTIAIPPEAKEESKESLVSDRLNVPLQSAECLPVLSESVNKVSLLEERLKEPPKIVIPNADMKVCDTLLTSKMSLLLQKDAKIANPQKVEHPKIIERMDTQKKELEKSDSENVGSPRIILKIAKSAIADCGEPKSPKSPKVRSATNSPNPEDSPGQKLGKIKLKLSRGGHPSIILNENSEESSQWHTESTSSLSPIGMKIKLTKSSEIPVIQSEKAENDEQVQQKTEDVKKTEVIGMKIKLSKTGDATIVQDSKEISPKFKEKTEVVQDTFKKTESSIGMKIKLSKTGDASIVQVEKPYLVDETREGTLKGKEKLESVQDSIKRTESPLGMKIKLSKSGDASIVSSDCSEEVKDAFDPSEKKDTLPEVAEVRESPIGMKIKLTKIKGGASIVPVDSAEEGVEKVDISDSLKRTESPLGVKIKLSKTGDASILHQDGFDDIKESTRQKEKSEVVGEFTKFADPSIGMKIKVSKTGEARILHCKSGDASIVQAEKLDYLEETKAKVCNLEALRRMESPIGMKIKLSKTGDASIVQTEIPGSIEETIQSSSKSEKEQNVDVSSQFLKGKHLKIKDLPIVDVEKKDKPQKSKELIKKLEEPSLEMKIKLSKTGHPTIVASEGRADSSSKNKESSDVHDSSSYTFNNENLLKDPPLTLNILHSSGEVSKELSHKRKDTLVTISSSESKKLKFESKLSKIFPEVTIQPITMKEQKQVLLDPGSKISREQINVISQEISITQVKSKVSSEVGSTNVAIDEKAYGSLNKVNSSPVGSDCEIIEHRPELVIVNENSNSSQDVVIIEEVPPIRLPEVKIPKKRGRPRRSDLNARFVEPVQMILPRDPLALDEASAHHETRENERPRRTCRSQKSYAPPKRGRGGRGRGKRKLDMIEIPSLKKSRIDQDLTAIEKSTMDIITIDAPSKKMEKSKEILELNNSLKQSSAQRKSYKFDKQMACEAKKRNVDLRKDTVHQTKSGVKLSEKSKGKNQDVVEITEICEIPMSSTLARIKNVSIDLPDVLEKVNDLNSTKKGIVHITENEKSSTMANEHQNWLTPSSKRISDASNRSEPISAVQVIDEETRMSAESGSRSQTPARNISAPTSETIVNEESQGSVHSTATTESEKVKVKNRRMEINFDPDEGPFTVDKIAEYEWPLDRKGETFMVQEQISQYLGVKSFKRKYPDLKRRIVDMEERNYLRENGLVSEAMCDMGLTAVCSSEVLDVMCSDFPDQYEEYRKHMREKQVKEHSKKQKELTAAANAERNRIDLAEMAVQSAVSWNINLNKSRMETRKSSLDLQTFTIHMPKKEQKLETERNVSHYPVALIPGQYTDYYREYTPAELRYYPLNTVLYGPMKPNERKFDSQSEGSQSDSDSDSSSDDSSSSSSDGTQGTEASQSTMDDVDMELVLQKNDPKSVKIIC